MTFGIISLFILSALAPLSLGFDIKITDEQTNVEDYKFDRYLYPEYYDSYNADEIPGFIEYQNYDVSTNQGGSEAIESNPIEMTIQLLDGPMDSPWPMFKNNKRNTGCSTYNTLNNPGFEKWWYKTEWGFVQGSAAIDNDGVIYFGSWDNHLYAINSDGSLKWKLDIWGNVETSPAIDENGMIYVGITSPSADYRFYAINPNGTHKWAYPGTNIYSSPVIANDGTIVFADADNWNIIALYPNGTLKWAYHTNHVVYSSPAIGDDGTIYCGSHDGALYALYPNNGTLKWAFGTGNWIRTSPCIGDDGTIYVVSLDNYLYAVYPNGTMKWKINVGAGTHPSIGPDGTIYAGYTKLHAVNPSNGSVKWTYDVPGKIRAGAPCISNDGMIYFGTSDAGYFVALNPDGTEKWCKHIGTCEFAPIIDKDGTIYIGSSNQEFTGTGYILTGFLHAFNDLDPNAPTASDINGPSNGKIEISYDFTFKSTSPLGNDVYYYVEWGEQMNSGWVGPYGSGEIVTLSHYWRDSGDYTIRAKVKDTDNLWGPWGEFSVNMKVRSRATTNWLILQFLEQFPLLREVLLRLITK